MKQNDKILVIFTGGTIGSVRVFDEKLKKYMLVQPSEARKINPDAKDLSSLLLLTYQKKYPNDFNNFKTLPIMEKFSEEFTIQVLADLTRKLRDINFNEYKGVIITHGTDTIGYTSNYLATILNDVKVPVFLVSSNYPVDDNKANGILNFKAAVDYILNVGIPGVYVSYCNDIYNKVTSILYGSRVTQCKSPTDTIEGLSYHKPSMSPLALMYDNGNIKISDQLLFEKLKDRKPLGKSYIIQMNGLNSKILQINPYIGLNYNYFDINGNIDAVLHTLYHSGTVCENKNDMVYNIEEFIKKCKLRNVPIFLGPAYGKEDRDIYSTMSLLSKEKVLMNTSIENAYAKLLVGYQIFKKQEDIDLFMFTDINNEHILPDNKLKLQKR